MRHQIIPLVVIISALLAFAAGTYSYKNWIPPSTAGMKNGAVITWWDAAYRGVQLFLVSRDDQVGPKPYWFEFARFVAPATTVAATVLIFVARFRNWTWLWIARRGLLRHVIVCGLGRKGVAMVRDVRKQGKRVVVIERLADAAQVAVVMEMGVVVITGDASDPAVLKKAGVKKAAGVFVGCGGDNENVKVALRAMGLARPKAVVMPHIIDAEVRSALRDRHRNPPDNQPRRGVELNDFCHVDQAARAVLALRPLDHGKPIGPGSAVSPHLILIGFGQMGEAVLKQALKIAHYPNGKPLRVTIIDPLVDARWADFVGRHPNFENSLLSPIAIVDRHALDGLTTQVDAEIIKICDLPDTAVTIAICLLDDSEAMRLAAHLPLIVAEQHVPVLVQTHEASGIHDLVVSYRKTAFRNEPPRLNVFAFGQIESTATMKNWLTPGRDVAAKAIHDHYLKKYSPKNISKRRRQHLPWDDLDESFRDSNRQAADFVPVLFGSFGHPGVDLSNMSGKKDAPRPDWQERKAMRQTEHRRWYAERYLAGWTFAPNRNDERMEHPCMVDWNKLKPADQGKDASQIRTYSLLIRGLGKRKQTICSRMVS